MLKRTHTKGITVVEVLIASAVFTVLMALATNTLVGFFAAASEQVAKTKAVHLVREGHEMVRFIRDEDWNTLAAEPVDTVRYLDFSGATPALAAGPAEVIDTDYQRLIRLRAVYRNGDDDLVASTTAGATVDTGSRWIHVEVLWGTESLRTSTLLTNIFDL